MKCNWIGFCHGQILIETATHSLAVLQCNALKNKQNWSKYNKNNFYQNIMPYSHCSLAKKWLIITLSYSAVFSVIQLENGDTFFKVPSFSFDHLPIVVGMFRCD